MCLKHCDVAVIGAGPAGLAAAIEAKKEGAENVVIIERDSSLGGILQQCIHPGFGLTYFNEELTGPEYAYQFINQLSKHGIESILDTMVLNIDKNNNIIYGVNSKNGLCTIKAKAIVLAMGCRERTRGAIGIPGTRPAGVYTAGTAQRLINMQNCMVGRKVVILGSGDIGMIMARRMTLEGAKVEAVVEMLPYLTGLKRNKVQCLDDFNIPLLFSHTVVDIKGGKRVEGVTICKVDENFEPIMSTQKDIECDTLLLSVGLIPENEVSKTTDIQLEPTTKGPVVDQMMQTNNSGIFACGNVVHVNDLVDNVTVESQIAGKYAALYSKDKISSEDRLIDVVGEENVRYVVPQKIRFSKTMDKEIVLYFRVKQPADNVKIQVVCGDNIISHLNKVKVNPGEMEHIKVDIDKIKDEQQSIRLKVAERG